MSDRLEKAIDRALEQGKPIWLKSYVLQDSAEAALQAMVLQTLGHYGQAEVGGAVHAGVRELVQNASKASLKRVVFSELGLDPTNEHDYEEGITLFRRYLVESQVARYRARFRNRGFFVRIEIQHNPRAAVFCVENQSELLPHEEDRIRKKFVLAQDLDNLFDFYLRFGDNTEGAGMGIAMVEILLQEAGIPAHNFAIFSRPGSGVTSARIVVPLVSDYKSTRDRFDDLRTELGLSAEELRARVRSGEIDLDPLKR